MNTIKAVRIETAITQAMVREGRVDTRRGLIYEADSGAMVTIGEALDNGSIVASVFTRSEVESDINNEAGGKTFWLEIFHRRHDTFLLEGIYDTYNNKLLKVAEALEMGLIDAVHGLYKHIASGETITLEEAYQQGLIQTVPQLRPPCTDMVTRKFDTIHVRTIEDELIEKIYVAPPLPATVDNTVSVTRKHTETYTRSSISYGDQVSFLFDLFSLLLHKLYTSIVYWAVYMLCFDVVSKNYTYNLVSYEYIYIHLNPHFNMAKNIHFLYWFSPGHGLTVLLQSILL